MRFSLPSSINGGCRIKRQQRASERCEAYNVKIVISDWLASIDLNMKMYSLVNLVGT